VWMAPDMQVRVSSSVGDPSLAKAFLAPRRINPDTRAARLLHVCEAGAIAFGALALRRVERFILTFLGSHHHASNRSIDRLVSPMQTCMDAYHERGGPATSQPIS
jgi:hypothetical protein